MADLTRIQFKRSKVANKVPAFSDISEGELAINLTDKRIFSNDGTSIIELGFSKGGTVDGDIIAKNITAVNTLEVKNIQGAAKSVKILNTKTLTENVYVRAFENATFNGLEFGAENLPSTTLQLQLPKAGTAGTLVINGAANLVNNPITNVGVLDTGTTIDGPAIIVRGNSSNARIIEGRLDGTQSWTIGKASKSDNVFSIKYFGLTPGAVNTQLLMNGATTRIAGTPLNIDSSIAAGFVGASSLGQGSVALFSPNNGIVGTVDGVSLTTDQKSFLQTSLASQSINASYPLVINYPSVSKAQISLFSGNANTELSTNIGTEDAPVYSHYLRGLGRVDVESSQGLYVKNNTITLTDTQSTPKLTSMSTVVTPARSIWMRGRSDLNATIWQTSVLGNVFKIGAGTVEEAKGLSVDSTGLINADRLQLAATTAGNVITIPSMATGNAIVGLSTPAAVYLPLLNEQQTIGMKWTIAGERNVCAIGAYPRPAGGIDLFQITMNNALWRFHSDGALHMIKGANYDNDNFWRLYGDGRASFIDVEIRSDMRHKTNVNTIENALDKVLALEGLEYDLMLGDGNTARSAGVSAQDVEKVLPQLVSEDEAGRKNLKYNGLIGLLINAVKELKAEVDVLKNR